MYLINHFEDLVDEAIYVKSLRKSSSMTTGCWEGMYSCTAKEAYISCGMQLCKVSLSPKCLMCSIHNYYIEVLESYLMETPAHLPEAVIFPHDHPISYPFCLHEC
jgi:hypothetical protein